MPGSSPRQQEPASPPNPREQVIEADDDEVPEQGDSDSAFGHDAESSTASITSSILHYRTLHGRTYHCERGNAQYWGSNDEAQSDTMDIAHHMFTLAQGGKLHLAPIDSKIQKALDVGCGTGMWAIDFADEHPGCEVIGTDVSPIQPSWVPPNLKFEIEDCTQDWTFAADSFDYVYMRYLDGCIPDWKEQFKQAFRVLKPGGYLESFEASPNIESDDGTVAPGSPLNRWGDIFYEAGRKSGRTFTVIEEGLQRKCMEEAGFVDLQEWDFKCPMSPWPKDPELREVGLYGEVFSTQDTEGFVLFVANMLGWSIEEVHVFIKTVRRDIRNRRIHPYFRLKVVWGCKPEEALAV
ncbi:S-adenosyl-L-methionine-dependent methyltransferase [Thelonectria olida]|uniref:S-adenosyl-L-methionine-dependent methyltransferase n=1 Tax=Thelonectria olida TaxID=1576542 RepID=A0A9P8VPI5_9HYPO|nr:S-adenosyl-L-methionine-dependent methyltransferase [Thelonectria olida]